MRNKWEGTHMDADGAGAFRKTTSQLNLYKYPLPKKKKRNNPMCFPLRNKTEVGRSGVVLREAQSKLSMPVNQQTGLKENVICCAQNDDSREEDIDCRQIIRRVPDGKSSRIISQDVD